MAFSLRSPRWRRLAGAIVPVRVALPHVAALLTSVLLAAGLTAGLALAQQADRQPNLRFFRIGTGASDGSYFPIGGLIASAISSPPGARACDQGGSCGVPGLIAVAQSTEGSVENIELIDKGQLESGLSQANVALDAYEGRESFARAPVKKLRAIAGLYREAIHIVVRANSGIRTIAQLRGKRIGVGAEGSGTLLDAESVLEVYDIRRPSVQFRELRPGQASDALKSRAIDAFFLVAGAPNLVVTELAESTPIRLLPVSAQKLAELRRAHPSFGRAVIPAGSYKGVGEVPAISIAAMWVTSADVDADLIYGIAKALWDESAKKMLESGGPDGRQITLQTALDGVNIPLHPGAERYYRAMGLIKDAPGKAAPAPPGR